LEKERRGKTKADRKIFRRELVFIALFALLAGSAVAYNVKFTAFSDATCGTAVASTTIEANACQVDGSNGEKILCASNSASSAWTYQAFLNSTTCAGTGADAAVGNGTACVASFGISYQVDCSPAAAVTPVTGLIAALALVAAAFVAKH
jgi:hypothetical protein